MEKILRLKQLINQLHDKEFNDFISSNFDRIAITNLIFDASLYRFQKQINNLNDYTKMYDIMIENVNEMIIKRKNKSNQKIVLPKKNKTRFNQLYGPLISYIANFLSNFDIINKFEIGNKHIFISIRQNIPDSLKTITSSIFTKCLKYSIYNSKLFNWYRFYNNKIETLEISTQLMIETFFSEKFKPIGWPVSRNNDWIYYVKKFKKPLIKDDLKQLKELFTKNNLQKLKMYASKNIQFHHQNMDSSKQLYQHILNKNENYLQYIIDSLASRGILKSIKQLEIHLPCLIEDTWELPQCFNKSETNLLPKLKCLSTTNIEWIDFEDDEQQQSLNYISRYDDEIFQYYTEANIEIKKNTYKNKFNLFNQLTKYSGLCSNNIRKHLTNLDTFHGRLRDYLYLSKKQQQKFEKLCLNWCNTDYKQCKEYITPDNFTNPIIHTVYLIATKAYGVCSTLSEIQCITKSILNKNNLKNIQNIAIHVDYINEEIFNYLLKYLLDASTTHTANIKIQNIQLNNPIQPVQQIIKFIESINKTKFKTTVTQNKTFLSTQANHDINIKNTVYCTQCKWNIF